MEGNSFPWSSGTIFFLSVKGWESDVKGLKIQPFKHREVQPRLHNSPQMLPLPKSAFEVIHSQYLSSFSPPATQSALNVKCLCHQPCQAFYKKQLSSWQTVLSQSLVFNLAVSCSLPLILFLTLSLFVSVTRASRRSTLPAATPCRSTGRWEYLNPCGPRDKPNSTIMPCSA